MTDLEKVWYVFDAEESLLKFSIALKMKNNEDWKNNDGQRLVELNILREVIKGYYKYNYFPEN